MARSPLPVRFVDRGAIEFGRELGDSAALSSTQILMMSTFLAALSWTALRASAAVVTQMGAVVRPWFRCRHAASGRKDPGEPRHRPRASLEWRVSGVLAQAHRRTHTEVRAPREVVDDRVRRLAQVIVRIDERWHHGLTGQVDSHCAGGRLHVGPPADLR
jgi:hypothetical protein